MGGVDTSGVRLRGRLARLVLFAGMFLTLAAWTAAAAHGVTFTGPTNFGVGNSPQAVAAADFNGDSDPDLAVVNEFSHNVSVLLGGAGGSFTGPTDFAVGTRPLWLAIGDFNGDSDPDLAVVNESTNDVSVLLGAAGGSFTGPTNFAVGTAPQSVVVAEFNGDSDPDLAVANEGTNNVSVLLGGAGGSFTAPTNFAVGSTPRAVAAGDFNGDSDPDLAVANEGTNNVSILLGGAGGSFSGPTNFAVCAAPISVAVGDFNGDSDPDLAVANELCHDVSVLLGGAGGSFSGPTDFATGDLPDAVVVGEFNGDLDPDLVVANQGSDNISVLLGGVGGGFTGPTNFGAGDGPSAIAVAQFNGDAALDLAVANEISNNLSVLLGDSTPPDPPSLTGTDPASPANNNSPKVKGTAEAGSTVRLYKAPTTADCTAAKLAATGSAADFSSPGLSVSVADDSTTTFRATATDALGNSSGCSSSSIVYSEHSSAPAAPSLTGTDPASPANNNSPKVTGTAAAGSTVRLYKAPTTADCTLANLAATGSAADFSSPGLSVLVADDSTTTFRATATDALGNSSGCSSSSIAYSEDSSAPAPPSLTDTDPDSPANDNSPRVKGTAEAGSTVRLYKAPTTADCTEANLAATGSAADFSSPGLSVSVADDSTTTFRATATDAVGNTSGCSSSSIAYSEDSSAPALPTFTGTDPASPANNNSPKVKGTAEAGSTVRLYKAPTTADCTLANLAATGSAADFSSPGLSVSVAGDTTTTFRATVTDALGNTSGCSSSSIAYSEDSSAPAAPSVTGTDPASPANNNSPKVKGTAEADSTVRLYKASTTGGCTAANLVATGTAADFSSPGLQVTAADNLSTRFRATATDAAGNKSACSSSSIVYVEDSKPPGLPTLSGTDPASPANNNSPKVKGTATAGTTVRLYKAATTSDCTLANLVATGTAAEFASPGFQVSVPDNSSTRFRATATDVAGNTSACSTSSRVYVEDSKPPGLPTLSGTDPASPANNNSPKVKGTATAGTTVRLYKAATTSDCTAANLVATGTAAEFASPGFEVSVPDDSSTRFRATATDSAGNTSACSTSSKVYVEDSTPPPGPTFTSTNPASPANNNSPMVKGTAAAGSTVRLYKADTTADCTAGNLAATGTAAAFASPGLQVSVPDNSTTTFRATATDAAGNTSPCSAGSRVYVEDSTLAGP
jgi:large repetitive protein